jgi:hypothetical protein
VIQEAGPEHVTHLPPATHGAAYRLRRLLQQPHKKTSDWYVTTGTFAAHAPNAERPNLFRAGCLVLDCDLADFQAASVTLNGGTTAQFEEAAKTAKAALHALDAVALNALVDAQAAYVNAWAARTAGSAPTVTISSGYGVHCYLWIGDAQGYGAEAELARTVNKALIDRLNAAVGFRLADPQASDAGTRILRIPGTVNTKNPALPRAVRILYGDASRRVDLHGLAAAFGQAFNSSAAGGRVTAPGVSHFPNPSERPPAPAKPANTAHATGGADAAPDFGALFAKSEQEAREALNELFRICPFFLWACENPTALKRESWRGAATNIAAISGEHGREVFHDFSRLDPARYSPRDCDAAYNDALKSAASHGPMTYAALSQNGDWPGSGPAQVRSPAALRFLGKAARLITSPAGQGENAVVLDPKTGLPKKTPGNLRKILRIDERYGKRLRFNEMAMRPEHDGEAFADAGYGDCGEYLEDAYHVAFPREWIQNAVPEVAQENPYQPVKNWLTSLKWDGESRIASVVSDVLNVEPRPLYVDFVKRFLIGAVARAICDAPDGVKLDTVLILKGGQGIGKSTFFNVLAGSFFCDTAIDLHSKDAFMVLRSAWIIEWSEFDYTLSRNQQSAVRAFLSTRTDSYRPPFGRSVVTLHRRCVIVGTTNEEHFLHDPTGSRRFWVIEIPKSSRVDLALLRSMRDQLWAEAVALYQAGEPWHLDSENDAERDALAGQYQQEEPWEGIVQRWIADKKIDDVSIERVLTECVLKEAKDWRTSDGQTVGRILKKLSFARYRVMVEGKREYRYRKTGGTFASDGDAASTAPNVVPIDPALRRVFREAP